MTTTQNTAAITRPTTYTELDALVGMLRAAGREELVHYAGACHRDSFAWLMVVEYLAGPDLSEADLRIRVHAGLGRPVDHKHIRRTYSTVPGQFWAPPTLAEAAGAQR